MRKTKIKTLLFNGKLFACKPGETALDALLRQKVSVPYSCMMQSLNCAPERDMEIVLNQEK